MGKNFWTVEEIIENFKIRQDFIYILEKEKVITLFSDDKGNHNLLPASDLDKLLVAKTLIEDMDVNIPGVEVVLSMRQNMFEMRCRFDEILQSLVEEFRKMLNLHKKKNS